MALFHFSVAAKNHQCNNRLAGLAWLVLFPVTALVLTAAGDAAAADALEHFDAVIVGAGWAGLKAARTLVDAGVSSVLVLEAADHVGGRSKSVNSDGAINVPALGDAANVPVDLGSEWLYLDNDMEYHLRDSGFLEGVDLYTDAAAYLYLFNAQFYRQSVEAGGDITTVVMDDAETNELRERVWEGYLSFRREQLRTNGAQSVASAVEKFKAQLSDERDIQYLNLIADTGEIDYIGETDELNLGDYRWFDEEKCAMPYMSVPGVGFGNVAAAFAAPLLSKIKLGATVTGIDDEDPERALVSYTEKGETRQVAATTVLVTASLGVLKAGAISFAPALPAWKQEVIDNMGWGVMNKCILQWEDPEALVWPEEQTWFELITPEDDSSGKWTTFFNPSQFKGVPMLVGWIGGAEAKAMESQTDDEVLDDVMTHLAAMFPTITAPDRVVVTRWGQEEHVRGTYCFKAVGRNYARDSNKLRRRVGRVRFAGEATHEIWYGTTYGGWKTGEEEALKMAAEIANVSPAAPATVPVVSSEETPAGGPSPAAPAAVPDASSEETSASGLVPSSISLMFLGGILLNLLI